MSIPLAVCPSKRTGKSHLGQLIKKTCYKGLLCERHGFGKLRMCSFYDSAGVFYDSMFPTPQVASKSAVQRRFFPISLKPHFFCVVSRWQVQPSIVGEARTLKITVRYNGQLSVVLDGQFDRHKAADQKITLGTKSPLLKNISLKVSNKPLPHRRSYKRDAKCSVEVTTTPEHLLGGAQRQLFAGCSPNQNSHSFPSCLCLFHWRFVRQNGQESRTWGN